MSTTKVTFTLDEVAISKLKDAAARLSVPRSKVVREAVVEFHDRLGRLSERERLTMLHKFDELVPKIPSRDAAEVERELADLKQARKSSGRRTLRRKQA